MTKYCKVTQAACNACAETCVRNAPYTEPTEMLLDWRDWVSIANVVAMVLLIMLAGWASVFVPDVTAWIKGLL